MIAPRDYLTFYCGPSAVSDFCLQNFFFAANAWKTTVLRLSAFFRFPLIFATRGACFPALPHPTLVVTLLLVCEKHFVTCTEIKRWCEREKKEIGTEKKRNKRFYEDNTCFITFRRPDAYIRCL